MAEPPELFVTVNGRRCSRSRRRNLSTSFSSNSTTALPETAVVPISSTSVQAEPSSEAGTESGSSLLPSTSAPAATPVPVSSPVPSQNPPSNLPSNLPPPPVEDDQTEIPSAPATISSALETSILPSASQPVDQPPPETSVLSSLIPGTIESLVSVESLPTPSVVPQEPQPQIPPNNGAVAAQNAPSTILPSPDIDSNSLAPVLTSTSSQPAPRPSIIIESSSIVTSVSSRSSSGTTPTAPADGAIDSPVVSETSVASSHNNITAGQIAGGTVAGVVGLSIIVGLLFLFFKRRKDGKSLFSRRSSGGEKGGIDHEGGSEPLTSSRPSQRGIFGLFAAVGRSSRSSSRPNGQPRNTLTRTSEGDRWSDRTSEPTAVSHHRSMSAPISAFRGSSNVPAAGAITRVSSSESPPKTSEPPSPVSPLSPIANFPPPAANGSPAPFALPTPIHLTVTNPDSPSSRATSSRSNTPTPAHPSSLRIIPRKPPPAPALEDPFIDPPSPAAQRQRQQYRASHTRSISLLAPHLHTSAINPYTNAPYQAPPPSKPLPPRASAVPSYSYYASDSARSSSAYPTPYLSSARGLRGQSDPFDLDRPEVLGYGNVAGRREVRESMRTGGGGAAGGAMGGGKRVSRTPRIWGVA